MELQLATGKLELADKIKLFDLNGNGKLDSNGNGRFDYNGNGLVGIILANRLIELGHK